MLLLLVLAMIFTVGLFFFVCFAGKKVWKAEDEKKKKEEEEKKKVRRGRFRSSRNHIKNQGHHLDEQ